MKSILTFVRDEKRSFTFATRAFQFILCMGLLMLPANPGNAASVPSGFTDTDVSGYLPEVAGIAFETNGLMYAWERAGRVWIYENDVRLAAPLIDISPEVGAWDDHGLLGFTLDPNFRQNGYIYLLYVVDHHHLQYFGTGNYNANANDYNRATIGRITRYTARSSDNFRTVDPASRFILVGDSITNGFPMLFVTHGIGTLAFGRDGTLLATCGDGGNLSDAGSDPVSYYANGLAEGIIRPKENIGAYRSQLLDCLNGKLIRIDPLTGNGLPSNPFYDGANPRSARSRVWALGLRNPFRMTVRPGTGSTDPTAGDPGTVYIGDVGYLTWEETDVITGPGMNMGWPLFEGYSSGLNGNMPANQDAPNPLYGIGGCTKQFFTFDDLLKEASLSAPSWPNPCAPAQQIPASIPRFVHSRPAFDWHHGSGPSRAGTFVGNTATTIDIGAVGSPIAGLQFGGNCSIGGVWYQGITFPLQYQNTYFFADVDAGWLKYATFNSNNIPGSINTFSADAGATVGMAVHPGNGRLYYVTFYDGIRKISYAGNVNLPPTAVATSDKIYGAGPLTVQFTGSNSTDPENLALSYSWNWGDGTANGTTANPSHTFTATPGVPTKYTVTLTVTDSTSQTSTTTLIISVNNTPPVISITSPAAGLLYPMTGDTTYNLLAAVTDTEHSDAQLTYQWQTVLHHNNHFHPNPVDTNHVTSTVLTPVGCDGNLYFYRITLTVSDPAGLSAQAQVDLYPNCTGNTAPTITDIANQTINQNTTAGPLAFTVGDAESAAASLVTTGSSSNPTLVPNANIVLGGSGASRTVTVTPAAGQSGAATITVTVSDGSLTAADTFLLTVNSPSNTSPSISGVPGQSISEDGSTGPLNFAVTDGETAAASLAVTGVSSNPALVPNASLVFGGSGTNRTVTVTPAANQSGTTTITLTVSDGSLSASTNFLVTVNAVNDIPTISDISNQSINQNTATSPLTFTVGDIETTAASLVVSGTSSNPTLVPNANILFGGTGANRTVTVTPAANQSGTSTITVSISDGAASASDTFLLTVNAVNTAPTISNIPDQTVNESTATAALAFTIGDLETAAASLVVSGTSSNPTLVPNANIVFAGSGANRTVTITPAAGQSGVATITVTVTDGALTASDTINLTVNSAAATYLLNEGFEGTGFENTGWTKNGTPNEDFTTTALNGAQSLNCVGAQYIQRTFVNTNSFYLYFQVRWTTWADYNNVIFWDNSSYNSAATLYGDDNKLLLIHGSVSALGSTVIVPGTTYHVWVEWTKGTGANGMMKLFMSTTGTKPASAEASITTGTGTATQRMYVGPTGAGPNVIFDRLLIDDVPIGSNPGGNQAPTISNIADQSINQDTTTGPINFTVNDAETAAASLTVTATSSNPVLLPNANIALGGSGSARTLTLTPAAGQTGTATVTVTVSDGTLSATDTLLLSVSAVNNTPTISDIANQTINEDSSISALPFTISDTETPAASLVVTATSSNPSLIPNASIVLGGSGAGRTLTITPLANQSGIATITVTVSDGTASAADTLTVTVNPVNDLPTLSGLASQTVNEDTTTGALAFTIGDVETVASALTLTGSSSDQTLVPNANIVFGGSASNRTVTVIPAVNQSGTATITINVNDGTATVSGAFLLTVNPVNDAPTISDILNQTINQDTSTGPLTFVIGDAETAAASLTVSGTSSNPTLVPNANIVFGGSSSNRAVTVTPAASLTGTATITVTVSDGTLSTSDTFLLTVNPVNTAPTISDIADQTINEDGIAGALAFNIGDAETAATSLTVSGSSSNPALVPNANITFVGSGASRTVTVTPAANQSGTAIITVTVSDGTLSASDTFLLTVNPVNDAPAISDIPNQTINEDTATAALAFTISDVETAAASLIVSGSSSNPTLVPNANIVFAGSGTSRTVTITPAANQSGTTTITVTVSDGSASASDTLVVTVNPVNDLPTISDIANQTILQDTTTAALTFTIGDVETAAASLTVSGSSSNPALVPNANIIFAGSGASRTVTVAPAAGQSGTATITVTISDGSGTASDTFLLTVTSSSAPTYLLVEGFEGTGFENTGWTKTGSANPDYTTTILHGSQSLNCSGAQYIQRSSQFSTSFNLYYRVRWVTWRNYANVIYWDNASYGSAASIYAGANRLEINHGSANAAGTTPISAGTTYHVWVEWTKGTGSNGTMKLFISTTGIKPASPEAAIATGNGGTTERIYVGPTATGPNVIFDRLLLDDVPIGSNP